MAKASNVNEQHTIDDIWNVWVDYDYLPEFITPNDEQSEPENVEIKAIRFERGGLDILFYLDETVVEQLVETILDSIHEEQDEPS